MKKHIIFSLLCFIAFGSITFAQRPKPAPMQSEPIAITGATLHTATGSVLSNTTIVFDKGVITSIGGVVPQGAKIIDAKGKHVYPGFILVNNALGLVEISATNATVDFNEANSMVPEIRTLVAFNTDSHVIPTVRSNGVLLTQPVLSRGLLAGTSSVMQLDAWNWEDAVVKADNVLHLNWPEIRRYSDEKRTKERETKRQEEIQELKGLFARARVYNKNGGVKEYKLESVSPVFSGDKTIFASVSGPNEALEFMKFVKDFDLPKAVLLGDASLNSVLDDIKKSGLSLIVTNPHSLPPSPSSSPRITYEFARMVSEKGILHGLDYSARKDFSDSRNLGFLAGTTAAYGLDKEKALQSITLNLAKMLGIDDKYGSLELGKSATLFISEGDALDQLTQKVTQAFIDGRSIELENHQDVLYERYKEKYSKQDQK